MRSQLTDSARKDLSTKGRSIQESDLVYSLQLKSQSIRRVELKDQEISEQTKQKFEKLKGKYPKVFSSK